MSFFPGAAAAAPPLLFVIFCDCFVDDDDEELFLGEGSPLSAVSLWLLSPKAEAACVARMLSALAAAWAMALHSPLRRMFEARMERRWQKSR